MFPNKKRKEVSWGPGLEKDSTEEKGKMCNQPKIESAKKRKLKK